MNIQTMNDPHDYRGKSKGTAIKNLVRAVIRGEDCASAVRFWGDVNFNHFLGEYLGDIAQKKVRDEPFVSNLPQQYTIEENSRVLVKPERIEEDFFSLNGQLRRHSVTLFLTFWENVEVYHTIATMRRQQESVLWQTAGKQVEKPLMTALCQVFKVPVKHFDQTKLPTSLREVDFYLIDKAGDFKRCEVKLMGRGNLESADAVVARDTDVFVADRLNAKVRGWLSDPKRPIQWVELSAERGYAKFAAVLKAFDIPHTPFKGDISVAVEKILDAMPDEMVQKMAQELDNPIADAT